MDVDPQRSKFDVFISYRRSDSEGHAGRLYDSIKNDYNVFMDVDLIQTGENFRQTVTRFLAKTECFLCVIGKRWATASNDAGIRLSQTDDPVRVEVEAALERGIAFIPILVWDAVMPSKSELPDSLAEIADIDALSLSHKQWDDDIDRLRKTVKQRVSASRGRGVSKLGRRWPPLEGRAIFTRWLNDDHPPTLVGRNGGVNSKLLKEDVETGRWKKQRYEVAYIPQPTPTPPNWLKVEEFVEKIAPNVTKEPAVMKTSDERLTGDEIIRRFRANESAPILMSRIGGLKGKLMSADVEAGGWADREYQVSYSDVAPPRNWFYVRDFAEAVEAASKPQDNSTV